MRKKLHRFFKIYKEEGLLKAVQKTFCYMTNWRARRDDTIWFLKRFWGRHFGLLIHVHGLKYYLHYDDPGISKELAIYHIHEPMTTDLFKKYVRSGMYIVDIGSNIGYYAILAASLVGHSGKVLAIEPEPRNCQLLKINVDANAIRNIEVVQCAVADYDGVGILYIGETSNVHSLIDSYGRVVSSVTVEVRKLDTLLKELDFPRVDLIRMDIEGGEIKAIEGMHKTLKQYKPCLLIELHCDAVGTNSIMNLIRDLEDLGYIAKYVIDRDKDFAWEKNRSILKVASTAELVKLVQNYRVATVLLK